MREFHENVLSPKHRTFGFKNDVPVPPPKPLGCKLKIPSYKANLTPGVHETEQTNKTVPANVVV